MAITGPFTVSYPVNFYSGGDTTREAFGKHINEIKRIYECINAVNADSASTGTLQGMLETHINDTNPHPKWTPSLSFDNITGSLDGSRLTGEIDASLIHGKLTNATIDASKIDNLKDFVGDLVPDSKGDGITKTSISDNGYVQFNNGLIVQWGSTKKQYNYVNPNTSTSQDFPTEFKTNCFVVMLQPHMDGFAQGLETEASVVKTTLKGFEFVHDKYHASYADGPRAWWANFIAIGN